MHSGQRGYVVCGTAYCYGEDITPRGYVRIYDIIEVCQLNIFFNLS